MNLSLPTVSLDLLLMTVQHYIMARFASRFIRTKKPALFCILLTVLYTLGYAVVEYFFPAYKGYKTVILPLLTIVLMILFRERALLKTILYPVILHILILGCDFLLLFFFRAVLPDHIEELMSVSVRGDIPIGSFQFSLLLLLRIAGIVAMFIVSLITYYLLRGGKDSDDFSDKRLNQFVPIFILEIVFTGFLMTFVARTSITDANVIWLMIGFMILFYVLDVLILRMLRSVESAEQLRHEKAELALYAEANTVAYNQILEGNTRFRMLRHDMLNQLQTAGILLERGETGKAAKQLQTYADDIRSSGKTVTGNSIVDAVLSIKESICAEAGFPLEVSGKLPDKTPLNNVELCGVVGNLLDNAIHAVTDLHLPAGTEESTIRFCVGIKSDKLVVSCKNPSAGLTERKIASPGIESEHGWGLYILDKLASKHGGAFTLTEENGIATALFWIPFEDEEKLK